MHCYCFLLLGSLDFTFCILPLFCFSYFFLINLVLIQHSLRSHTHTCIHLHLLCKRSCVFFVIQFRPQQQYTYVLYTLYVSILLSKITCWLVCSIFVVDDILSLVFFLHLSPLPIPFLIFSVIMSTVIGFILNALLLKRARLKQI